MARDYARDRYAFGRPIGSFQAIKHKLADVYIAVELARSNAYYGAWALEADAADLPIAAAVARIAACEAGWIAAKENIQTHGGMGFTWAFDCHLYYRRARLLGLGARRRAGMEAPADRHPGRAQRAGAGGLREGRMDFDDSEDEAAFRAAARAFLDANAARRKPGAVEGYRRGQDRPGALERREGLPAPQGRGGLRRHQLARGLGRPRRHPDPADHLRPGGSALRRAHGDLRHRRQPRPADDLHLGHRRAAAPASRPRRCAGTRCGASCSPNPPAARTSPRLRTRAVRDGDGLGGERAEDLDLRRALQRLRHPARPHRPAGGRSTPGSATSSWT